MPKRGDVYSTRKSLKLDFYLQMFDRLHFSNVCDFLMELFALHLSLSSVRIYTFIFYVLWLRFLTKHMQSGNNRMNSILNAFT